MTPDPDNLTQFEAEVSEHMLRRYGITWADAAGDPEPLLDALADDESAEAFVSRWGEKYGLHQRPNTAADY